MSTNKVYEDKDKIIYERTDDGIFGTGLLATNAKDYKAVDKHSNAEATGKTVGEARANLDSGKS